MSNAYLYFFYVKNNYISCFMNHHNDFPTLPWKQNKQNIDLWITTNFTQNIYLKMYSSAIIVVILFFGSQEKYIFLRFFFLFYIKSRPSIICIHIRKRCYVRVYIYALESMNTLTKCTIRLMDEMRVWFLLHINV